MKYSDVPEILDKLKHIENASFKISYKQVAMHMNKRLKFIMELVYEFLMAGKEHTLETYYRVARTRGYNMLRKTFTRDIALLEKMGKINRKVIVGGKNGTTSIITKKRTEVNQNPVN